MFAVLYSRIGKGQIRMKHFGLQLCSDQALNYLYADFDTYEIVAASTFFYLGI